MSLHEGTGFWHFLVGPKLELKEHICQHGSDNKIRMSLHESTGLGPVCLQVRKSCFEVHLQTTSTRGPQHSRKKKEEKKRQRREERKRKEEERKRKTKEERVYLWFGVTF